MLGGAWILLRVMDGWPQNTQEDEPWIYGMGIVRDFCDWQVRKLAHRRAEATPLQQISPCMHVSFEAV
jgi:hypothetical protein